jgi:hypothetical protein
VSTFSGGFTTITVYGGTNYTLANAAISSVSYSPGKTPFGFPTDTGSWTASSSSSSNVNQNSPTANTIYNLGSLTLSIPIGIWRVSYQAILDGQRGSAAGAILCKVGLSTVNNTFSDNNLVSSVWAEPDTVAADARAILSCYRFEFISLAAKTSYFLNANMNNNGVGLAFRGDIAPSLILAECVYL